ncbi:MAG: 30S ribosomal protein S24e [Candidatus Methanomarinus sp.]|uniref:30S ribosomal protein S24e n=1 Tax=Candidatus Methanomarinus sp. TaxID=3386244 RepID=A0AC61SB39_9EURY|nr:MAG: small subunit ribosomal protein S24e [ANME-2 cluster archaeon]TKY91785.1 MAG: 30S ribosomal protein S24e [ANME-2 cluster archaeon]
MDIEIIKEKENPLLDRKEINFTISHTGPTPSRDEIKKNFVARYNSQHELVIVDKLSSEYGTQQTAGYVKIYSDTQRVSEIENRYIIERNKAKPIEKAQKEKVEDKTEPKAENEAEGETEPKAENEAEGETEPKAENEAEE